MAMTRPMLAAVSAAVLKGIMVAPMSPGVMLLFDAMSRGG
jgi:hypothetical protein